jgi:hypothetical protein
LLCFLGLLNKALQLHISQNSEQMNLWIINWKTRGKTPRDLFLRSYPSICWTLRKTTMRLRNVGIRTEDKTMCIQNPLQSPQSTNQPTNQSIYQSVGQPINQLINRSTDQSVGQSINQSLKKSFTVMNWKVLSRWKITRRYYSTN